MRDDFFALLMDAIVRPRSRARFVIALREDYLASLADLADQIPGLLRTSFYVGALSREQAHEAIRKPFEAFGVDLEKGLEVRIAQEIGIDRVASPQIQIVCDKLFSGRETDAVGFQDYQRLGGTRGILSEFLNEQIRLLEKDRASVVEILKSLVTSEGTKDVLSLQDLADRSDLPPDLLKGLVDHLLTHSRLLRPVSGRSGVRYELAHEYLTTEIWQWMSPEERSRREAQELIAADLRAWKTFDSLRLGLDRLEKYFEHAHDLKLDENVGTLLLLSSVRHSQPHDVWVEAISELDQRVQARVAWSLLRFIATRSDDQRFEAAEAIAALDHQVILRALEAPETDIRNAALYMAGGLSLGAAQPTLMEILRMSKDDRSAELACFALGEIGGPPVVDELIRRTSSRSDRVAAAAVRALGSCVTEPAFPYLAAALWGQQADKARAAQWGLAAALSEDLMRYLRREMRSRKDVHRATIELNMEERLWRILGGLDHARHGDHRLLAPFQKLIREISIDPAAFGTPWLINSLISILPNEPASKTTERKQVDLELFSGGAVLEAIKERDEFTVASALASAGTTSLPIIRELSGHSSSEVRLAMLMALAFYADVDDTTWRTYIRPPMLVKGLQDHDATIRYYACLAMENLELNECVQFLRPLTRDDTIGRWWAPAVGKRVSDAAHRALDSLRPESRVWRKDWQLEAYSL